LHKIKSFLWEDEKYEELAHNLANYIKNNFDKINNITSYQFFLESLIVKTKKKDYVNLMMQIFPKKAFLL
jgi:hypothetical protein